MSDLVEKSYERTVLFQAEEFEIVSILWNEKSISPMHNHDWSQCMVLVQEGTFENILDLGAKVEVQTVLAGQVITTPVGARHEIRCQSEQGKTIHVYFPKINDQTQLPKFDARLEEKLKEKMSLGDSTPIQELKKILLEFKDQSISTESPYFMNQLFAGVLPQMLMAEEFIAQTRTTLATYEASPALSNIEKEVVLALGQQMGWKENHCHGVSVPGGSAANFMAVHCARQKLFPEAKAEGVDGRNLIVFVSQESHYSFKKACAVLGMGTRNVISIPVDKKGRMIPSELDCAISIQKKEGKVPLIVCATAGTTVLGAFDPIGEIHSICKKHNLWLHVDGAWGGPAIFSSQRHQLVQGIELADSVTFDAHKLFGANLTSSFFLTQHNEILLQANDVAGGDYLFHADDETLDRGKLSWQCGRKADAMSFWAIWKSLGTSGLGQFVDRLMGIKSEILAWIQQQDRLELIAEPDYLNVCVRILSPGGNSNKNWSRIIRERLKEKNLAFVNYSTNSEGPFLRLILAHPFLQFQHVKQILEWALEEQ